jgi:hypothetical protein
MANEPKDEAPAASVDEWPKRAPPTIDLDASDVSGDTRTARGMNAARSFFKGAGERLSGLGFGGMLAKVAAPLSGAIAALLVLAALWAGDVIGPPQAPAPLVSPAQFDNIAANVGDLTARLARVESSVAKPAAAVTDPALTGRTEALEKSLAAVRDEVARVAAQISSVTASLAELKAPPRDGAAAPDLGPLSERLTRLEDATRALSTELAKPSVASVDDVNVRRLVVANTLDAAIRRGEPYAAALAVAKQVAASPASLAPLDAFAAKGIPAEAAYLREIVPVLQRIASETAKAKPGEAGEASARTGVLDRLQSGLSKLVRIERSDAPEARPSAPPAAADAAVRRDNLAATRQDLAKLPQAADPQIQAWIKSVDAREAALAASQKFSTEALAAFGKSGQ